MEERKEDREDESPELPESYDASRRRNKLGLDVSSLTRSLNVGNIVVPRIINDYAKIIPDLDRLASHMKAAIGASLPKSKLLEDLTYLNRAQFIPAIEATLPKFEVPNIELLPRFTQFGKTFARTFELLKRSLPPNWPDDINFATALMIVNDEGIPLVWVPREEIARSLLLAESHSGRLTILEEHVIDIAADCKALLSGIRHDFFLGQAQLADRAIDALEAGYFEAAQALAIVVTETAVARTLGSDYKKVKATVLFSVEENIPFVELRLKAALAPIGAFYTPWYVSSGTPPPENLSRHVAVHNADAGHYTRANAVGCGSSGVMRRGEF